MERQVLLVTGGEPLYSTEVIVWENIENIGNAVPGACLRIVDAIAIAIALHMRMRAQLLCACKGHYTAHVHNSQTCVPCPYLL